MKMKKNVVQKKRRYNTFNKKKEHGKFVILEIHSN